MFLRLILIISLVSIIFSNNRRSCMLNDGKHRSRPNLDTFHTSPSGHFYIHYDLNGINAPDQTDNFGASGETIPNLIPDYIDKVAEVADLFRFIIIEDFNFLPEVDDTDGIYDIYVKDRGNLDYGLNLEDFDIPSASYIIIDNEYEEEDYYTSGLNTMYLTVAHEFFHAIQRSYNSPAFGHTYFWEMTATWIEDTLVPSGNDYIFWIDNFFEDPNQDIDDTDGYSIALFSHYLINIIDSGNNSDIIRKIWENYSNTNNPLYSINFILENDYNITFEQAWVDFCSRNFFNGEYEDMNNDIYFHIDQKDIMSLSTLDSNLDNPTLINQTEVDNLNLTNKSSDHIAYVSNYNCTIDFEHTISSSSNILEGIISIKSQSNSDGNRQVTLGDDYSEDISLQEGDIVYLSYSSDSNAILDIITNYIDVDGTELLSGDSNIDSEINVIDVVIIIDFILEELNPNQFQFGNSDINSDYILNIFDVMLLIGLILEKN